MEQTVKLEMTKNEASLLSAVMEKQEQAIKDLQQDMRELTTLVQRLAVELQRTQDSLKNTAEREAYERKLFSASDRKPVAQSWSPISAIL